MIPSATPRPEAQLISLNAVIRRLGPSLARTADPVIKLEQRLYDQLDPILADPAAVERLVLAVVRSAREAMPEGGTLTIETDTVFLDPEFVARWKGMKPGAYSLLLIRDTRRPRRDSVGGTMQMSADLDEARMIAEKAGGRVEIDILVGSGRDCRIYFPAIDPEAAGGVAAHAPGGETILLVDDTESLREMIQRVLVGFGYTVLLARDGAQALEVSDHHVGQIDLLVSDVVMPGIGGPELAVRLRMRRPTLRVLLMSGYDEHSLATSAGSYASFIAKPFRPDVLGRKIREILDATETVQPPARG